MKKKSGYWVPGIIAVMAVSSCSKSSSTGMVTTPPPVTPPATDTTTKLKDATEIYMGTTVDYSTMLNDAGYATIAKRDFDGVTFGYSMKHGAIVKDNGTYDYSSADAIVNACSGLIIYGHTLGWHQNQNATFLKNYSGITGATGTELLTNPGFESGLTGWTVFNSGTPAGNATITATTAAGDIHSGAGAMKVVNPTAYPGVQYKVQVSGSAFATTIGNQYTISYWVKAASAGGSIRLSTGPSGAQYQPDQAIGTAWQQVSWTITASLSSTTILFDMGQAANTYYIDDASVKEVTQSGGNPAQVAAKLDTALNTFITTTVTRYKSVVKAWDVVNELFAENGALRDNTNTNTTASDVFVWSNYLGRDFPFKAFTYAKAADPNALLFINDYNLESSPAKLDSLIAMVNELKGRGAKVDGIGTQMHINWNTSHSGIDAMMQKLAATGLLIRISELDVRLNPQLQPGFALTPDEANNQADTYKYVVQSYIKYIPKAQQYGITIWGVTDNTSWLYNNGQDFPLLYNANYSKKPAYAAVLQALKGQ